MKLDGGGLSLAFELDGVTGAPIRAPSVLPVPGAAVVLSAAWLRGPTRFEVACARAPTRIWVPGLEGVVLDAASATVRRVTELSTLAVTPLGPEGGLERQSFSGQSSDRSAVGRHLLGFLGEARDVVVCTAVCTTSLASRASAGCDAWLESLRVEAAFVNAPAPGWLVRRGFEAAEHPRVAAAGVAAIGLLLCALLLARRPRSETVSLAPARAPSGAQKKAPE